MFVKMPSRNLIGSSSTEQCNTLRRSPRFLHQKNTPESKQPTNLRKSPRLHQKSATSELEDPKTPKSKSRNNRACPWDPSLISAKENKDNLKKDSQRTSKSDRGARNCWNLSSGLRRSPRLNNGVEAFRSLRRSPRFSSHKNVVDERMDYVEKTFEKRRKSDSGFNSCRSSASRKSPRLDSGIDVGGLRKSHRIYNQKNVIHKHVEKSSSVNSLDKEETDNGKAGKGAIPCEQVSGKRDGRTRATRGISIGPEVIVEGDEADNVINRKRKPDDECDDITKGWTKEQELALQRAYFAAKPTPHFWKRVSRLVPGKSAQECFDKVHSDNLTPLQPRPRSRAKKAQSSPLQHFSFSASRLLKPMAKRLNCNKQKTHLSQKSVRHLLQKHYHVDQDYEADLFSVLESNMDTSNQAVQPNVTLSTPKQLVGKHDFFQKFRERSSSVRKKPIPRSSSSSLTTLVSPPVLKQVKNRVLHEKYIDQLHCREAKRRAASARAQKSSVVKEDTNDIHNQNIDVVRAAKNALAYDARNVIDQYQHSQAIAMSNSDFNDGDDVDSNDDEGEDET
ncbi:hypothetical protein I3843_07G041200 [Carya illinoinensis]|uniref:Myb-like domain-containing protein n=1 Tax=Carya illinoinensis TaxID=32201 RepID=A0A8T1PQY7_CARIL|nr:uncharacterized protein LOC122315136 [Carya illinoinensis]KAG2696046.1 hypothetical protein I3760_07G040600 [Carya illinoinensis]KAG6646919.1 hypothetical protein CIPAW_07G042000 [Carya illinoinensis]KAG7969640.1 hypothetical protein I3843_07G041200 [Carya illinoinensis]